MIRGKTHQVALPAYDIKGNLIKAEKYRVALAGALASANEATNTDVRSIR